MDDVCVSRCRTVIALEACRGLRTRKGRYRLTSSSRPTRRFSHNYMTAVPVTVFETEAMFMTVSAVMAIRRCKSAKP